MKPTLILPTLTFTLVALLVALLPACPTRVVNDPTNPPADQDAAVAYDVPADSIHGICYLAEQNLIKYRCFDVLYPHGIESSFVDFCTGIQLRGTIDIHPACLATITRCEDVDRVCTWGGH